MTRYGLILETPTRTDYVFGGKVRLAGEVLQPDGQWDAHVPESEVQNLNGIEPYACVSFGTNNAIEVLEHRLFGHTNNYSDRFLATVSGTNWQKGNTPNFVINTLRKKGCPPESAWPFSESITTWDAFYAAIPQPVYSRAVELIAQYDIGHEWVSGDQQSMMDALQFSPLGVSVFGWQADSEGYYVRPLGAASNHWCICYGYERNRYWKIFDSYDNTHKKLRWDFGFEMVKRYTLHRQVIDETAWGQFKKLIFSLWPF